MADAYRYREDLDEAGAVGLALASLLDKLEYAPGKRLKAVHETFAEPEDRLTPPAIVVLTFEGDDEPGTLAPQEMSDTWDATQGKVLFKDGEFTADVTIEIVATDPRQRARLIRAVRERLIAPNGERTRRMMDVPRYYGGAVQAVIEPRGRARIEDSEDDAKRRYRLAYMTVGVQLDTLRIVSVPESRFSYRLEVDGVLRTP